MGGVPTNAALYLAVLPMNEKQGGELGSSLASPNSLFTQQYSR